MPMCRLLAGGDSKQRRGFAAATGKSGRSPSCPGTLSRRTPPFSNFGVQLCFWQMVCAAYLIYLMWRALSGETCKHHTKKKSTPQNTNKEKHPFVKMLIILFSPFSYSNRLPHLSLPAYRIEKRGTANSPHAARCPEQTHKLQSTRTQKARPACRNLPACPAPPRHTANLRQKSRLAAASLPHHVTPRAGAKK